jgi:hypothetical protein
MNEVISCSGFVIIKEGKQPAKRYTGNKENDLPGPDNVPVVEDRLRRRIQ